MNTAVTTPEEEARENLRLIIDKSGKSLRDLSLKCGKNASYIEQYIKKGSPRRLPELVRSKLASILNIEEHLISGLGSQRDFDANDGRKILRSPQPMLANVDLNTHFSVELKSGLLPLFGTVQGGSNGMLINGMPEGWIDRPGQLRGISDAFALKVVGDSMSPKYSHGDIIMANPHSRPVNGSYVVVSVRDAAGDFGYIKQFVKSDSETLTLRQLNPEKTLTFPMKSVTAICKVIGSMEGR